MCGVGSGKCIADECLPKQAKQLSDLIYETQRTSERNKISLESTAAAVGGAGASEQSATAEIYTINVPHTGCSPQRRRAGGHLDSERKTKSEDVENEK